jgi:ferredoxin-NADP reductase
MDKRTPGPFIVDHDGGTPFPMELQVRLVVEVAAGVRVVELESADGRALPPWSPGAHIDLRLGDHVRQYSLCGPVGASYWRLGILLEPKSRGGSEYVHVTLKSGDIVDVLALRNNFELQDAEEYLFIAGGIGVTPLIPMIADAERRDKPWRLVYGGRTRESMAFLNELTVYGNRATIVPQDETGYPDLPGAMASGGPGMQVYACGPEPLISAVRASMQALSLDSLYVERFRPKEVDTLGDGGDQAFDVVLARSSQTVTVAANESILDALGRAGVRVSTSCQEGVCGSCETKVLEGKPLHRDSLLTAEEQLEGATMMVCVGRARTPQLVLDL